jgi:transposase
MPSALSLDLRSRIVSACQAGELTQGEIAELFQVHLKTVEKLWRPFRRTGSVQAKPQSGGAKAHLAGQEEDLRRLVAEQSDHTLAE